MKKYLISLLMILTTVSANATVSDIFENSDMNAVRADISKYFIVRGAKISHGNDYNSDTLQAVMGGYEGRNQIVKNYAFKFTETESGTKVDMTLYKAVVGSTPSMADAVAEKTELEQIKASAKGKFLYGLGFEFQMYNTPNGAIKAPKGKDTGIKLTAVKYDAQLKGLKAGDIIVEINNTPLKDIPINEFATVLFAKNITDTLTLKVKSGNSYKTVTLTPRQSTRSIF